MEETIYTGIIHLTHKFNGQEYKENRNLEMHFHKLQDGTYRTSYFVWKGHWIFVDSEKCQDMQHVTLDWGQVWYDGKSSNPDRRRVMFEMGLEKYFKFEWTDIPYMNYQCGTDVYPYKVIRRVSNTKWEIQHMDYKWNAEKNDYDYIEVPDAPTQIVRLHKDHGFYFPGNNSTYLLACDYPRYYYDPEF